MITADIIRLSRFMVILCALTAICRQNVAKAWRWMNRIGILAGTFDPIHEGHINFARSALKLEDVDKIFFLVEPRPRRKQGVRSLEHRQAMAKLALQNENGTGMIELGQARFSVLKTLPLLQARFKGKRLALLFGDDVIKGMVEHMADWPHVEQLAQNTDLIIAARHHDQTELSAQLKMLKNDYKLGFRYQYVDPKRTDVSSSKIRLALKHGQTPNGLPKKVLNYIKKHRLYASSISK